MTEATPWHVREADWAREGERLRRLRDAVFVAEQGVSPEEEHDGRDPACIHVVAEDERGEAIGTGRLLPDGHIGRMAVRRDRRGAGVGRALLESLVACARERGFTRVELSAQTHAIAFYERNGFRAEGAEYMDAGIPHRHMTRTLERDSG